MRNFEERKAEVFRRSEKRIKERKRTRNRIISAGVSLCFVLIVWFVARLPETPIVNNDASSKMVSMLESEKVFTIDANENEQICSLIKSMFEDDEDYGVLAENEPQTSMSVFLPTGSLSSEYKFTLSDENDIVTYTLCGLVLTNEATGEKVTLTEEQYLQILDELGLHKGESE